MAGSEQHRSLRDRLDAREVSIRGKDGKDYVLRPIQPADAPSLIRGYDAMSERGKWFRMLHAVPHLTDEMAREFCAPDPQTECCVVIDGRDDLSDEILGGARVAGLGPGKAAEFSVSLRPEARGLGLARQALETVIEVARETGNTEVWGLIARQNSAMLKLAERVGFQNKRDLDDISLIRATIAL
ncbi:MAG: GNAT family N-acetyltransferase [Pseudomonadota bacterium]